MPPRSLVVASCQSVERQPVERQRPEALQVRLGTNQGQRQCALLDSQLGIEHVERAAGQGQPESQRGHRAHVGQALAPLQMRQRQAVVAQRGLEQAG